MASNFRDCTLEFHSLSHTFNNIVASIPPFHQHPQNAPSTSLSQASEFNRKASRIVFGIYEFSHKIIRLAQMAKKSSMFNDPIVEIQELTAIITNDITALKSALLDLQTIQNMEIADGNFSEDRIVQSNAVCDDLKGKLIGATK